MRFGEYMKASRTGRGPSGEHRCPGLAGRLNASDGFSFIEVMIVVVILAILATLLIPRVMGRTEDAKRAAAKAQISNIESALQLYKLDNGNLPFNGAGAEGVG
ncbi:MAG: type II secretion system protein GspG [Nitrospira sp.]